MILKTNLNQLIGAVAKFRHSFQRYIVSIFALERGFGSYIPWSKMKYKFVGIFDRDGPTLMSFFMENGKKLVSKEQVIGETAGFCRNNP